jgi:hypothetical protein
VEIGPVSEVVVIGQNDPVVLRTGDRVADLVWEVVCHGLDEVDGLVIYRKGNLWDGGAVHARERRGYNGGRQTHARTQRVAEDQYRPATLLGGEQASRYTPLARTSPGEKHDHIYPRNNSPKGTAGIFVKLPEVKTASKTRK